MRRNNAINFLLQKVKEFKNLFFSNRKRFLVFFLLFFGLMLFQHFIGLITLRLIIICWILYMWYLLNKKDFVGFKIMLFILIIWGVYSFFYWNIFILSF